MTKPTGLDPVPPLRWRRDGVGGYVARPHHAGPTYHIRTSMVYGRRSGRLYRLYVDGVELADASGCTLRHVKYRASTHVAGL